MRLHNRKGLLTLMVVREVSQRRLAAAAGYRSHSYLGRLLRGEVDTLEPTAALRIARHLEVDVGYLFRSRSAFEVLPPPLAHASSATPRVPLAASGCAGSLTGGRNS